ncbi:hypothetical protein PLICRDRAFT_63777, partial [Plicaturopsis crispa FD-325 SS-3]
WTADIIPALVDPHLRLLRVTASLRTVPPMGKARCTCDGLVRTRTLAVMCVGFEDVKKITIVVCPCMPAAVQLVERGLFPCAPHAPSLAV